MKHKLALLFALYLMLPLWYTILPEQDGLMALFGGQVCAQDVQNEDKPAKKSFWEQLQSLLSKKRSQDNKALSVTEKYPLYYNWIHQREQKFYDSLSQRSDFVTWDKYQDIITLDVKRSRDTSLRNKLAPNIKVFGWHPYWMGSAYKSYHFNHLSYLAWFSYSVDPFTGKYNNPDVINLWKNSDELFELAKAEGCKVLLTITNHTAAGNRVFLSNPESQRVLIDSLIVLLRKNGAGVDVNFENIPNGFGDEVTTFLQTLSSKIKKEIPGFILSVDLPVEDRSKAFELKKLEPFVDLFLVMGYDFYTSISKTDGPVAPLNAYNGQLNIRQSVDKYQQTGIAREKLLLGLPYYGAIWRAKSSGAGQLDPSLKFIRQIAYKEVKSLYPQQKPNYDHYRWSAYIINKVDSNYYEKCWYDDTITLGRKIDWVLEKKLGGIGIWALGFDNGHEDFWNLIQKKLVSDTSLVYTESYIESRHFKLGKSVMKYRSLIAVAGIFIVVFLVGGLVVALMDWRVREVFFQHKTLRLLYSLAAIAVLLSIYAFYLYVTGKPLLNNSNLFALGIGLTLGVGIALVVRYFHEKWTKSLP